MEKSTTKTRKDSYKESPMFPDKAYQLIAAVFYELVGNLKNYGRQMDIALFSVITMLSACFPRLYGTYFGKKVYPNLFGVVSGPPASGKSAMLLAKQIGDKIEAEYLRQNKENREEHRKKMEDWLIAKTGLPPEEPVEKHFLYPGNTTEPNFYSLLSKSDGIGTLVESETDVIARMVVQKFGDYTVILRKGFHHEPLTLSRKTFSEFISIECPKITLLLSGTPEQWPGLIKSAENGLFSRFCLYAYDDQPKFANPFSPDHIETVALFERFGEMIARKFFEAFGGPERAFRFTMDQEARFNAKFPDVVDEFYYEAGSEGVSIPIRMAVIFFRICMILTAVRNIDNHDGELVCHDGDFEATDLIVDVLLIHSHMVFSSLPASDDEAKELLADEELVKILPPTFESKAVAKVMAGKYGYSKRTAFRAIRRLLEKGLIHKVKLGNYRKGKPDDAK